MAVKIVGKSKDVDRYRKYLYEQGINTKRFVNHLRASGMQIKNKPDDFRIFNTPIQKVFGENKKGLLEEDQKLFIAGIANEKITDRMDEVLEPSGVDVRNYLKNRVLLMDHLYMTSAVIGRVYDLKTQDNGVHFEAYIGDPQKAVLTQQQKDARSLVAQRLVQTVSVGFIPIKIQAPTFDDDYKMIDPAIIMEWELLELSIVAVPANPGAVFDLKNCNTFNEKQTNNNSNLTNQKNKLKINSKKAEDDNGNMVQTLIFDKEYFNKEDALTWAEEHDYSVKECEENDNSYMIMQRQKEDFEESSLKTLQVQDGVKAKVGKLKTDINEDEEMEQKLEELLESMKGISTQLGALSDSIGSLGDNQSTILSKLEAIEPPKKPKEEEEEEEKDKMPKDEEEEKEEKKPKEEEEEDEEMKKDVSKLAKIVKSQAQTIDKLSEKMDVISQSLLKLFEASNG
jgi:phage head maturation protease